MIAAASFCARTRSWTDPDNENQIKPEAFFRRAPIVKDGAIVCPRDQDGLSVFRGDKITADECADQFGTCFGVVTVHAGTLRDLGLEIIADPEDDRKALITNLPFENPGDPAQEFLIGRVADSARVVLRCNKRRR